MNRDDRWEMMYLSYKRQIAKMKLEPKEVERLKQLLEQQDFERKVRAKKKGRPLRLRRDGRG